MKKIAILCILCLIACKEDHKSESKKDKQETSTSILEPQSLCFDIKDENGIVELFLKMNGDAVTGIYNWFPTEKDKREGKILANKDGKTIRGTYTFQQEGMKQEQPVIIKLTDSTAEITTNPKMEGELKLVAKKATCR